MTPTSVIEATTARVTARAEHRREIEPKLAYSSALAADTPARVQKRIARLAAGEMARAVPTNTEALPGMPPAIMAATVLDRIVGTNDMSVTFLELAVPVAKTVGRAQIRSGSGQLRGYGTEFVLAPRLLITNNHVLGSVADARPSPVAFNFPDGLDGATPSSVVFSLDPDAFFATDAALDYSVVAVRPGSGVTLALRQNRLIDILQFLPDHTDTGPRSCSRWMGSCGQPRLATARSTGRQRRRAREPDPDAPKVSRD